MSEILAEEHGSILLLVLNRPECMNAINMAMCDELIDHFEKASANPNIRAIIITGAGEKAFSAGADIREEENQTPIGLYRFTSVGFRLCQSIEMCRKPVIAAINGYALGGGLELSLACDFRLAAANARIGFPEVKLAVITGWGGSQRLPRLIGLARAKEMLLTGRMYSAKDALSMGIVNEVVPPDELVHRSLAFAEELAATGPLALELAKTVLNFSQDVSAPAGMTMEMLADAVCASSVDRNIGFSAFFAKEKPKYTGT